MPSPSAFTDRYGLALSTSSSVAAERYVEALDLYLSGNVGVEDKLADAIRADEGFALPHAALAFINMFYGRPALAKASGERARSLSGGISRREQQQIAVITAHLTGEAGRGAGLLREYMAEFPRDAMLLSLAWFTFSGSGRDWREQRLAYMQERQEDYGDDWWFSGMLGMALQDTDRFADARRLTERSLAQYPRNGGAAHALSHVYYETNDHRAGLEFLDGWMTPYEAVAPNHCHLTWHLALFELTSGRYRRALDLFEHGIRHADAARTQLPDAASLLWRCRLYGYTPASLPWEAVQVITTKKAPGPAMAFGAVHAALALAGGGDLAALDALEQALRDLATNGNELAGTVTAPLVAGIGAFARGDYDATIRLLAPVSDDVVRIGGSNAQREVFEETLLEALLRAGRYDEAEALLRRRLGRRESGRDHFWLGRVYAGRGEAALAAERRTAGASWWPAADTDAPEFGAGGYAAPTLPNRLEGDYARA